MSFIFDLLFKNYEVYNSKTQQWVKFTHCCVLDDGLLRYAKPGHNKLFEIDDNGDWNGKIIDSKKIDKSKALMYNQLQVRSYDDI